MYIVASVLCLLGMVLAYLKGAHDQRVHFENLAHRGAYHKILTEE